MKQKWLVVSDIDGVVREIYSKLYNIYRKNTDKKLSQEEFLDKVVYRINENTISIMRNLIGIAGNSIYMDSRPDDKIIGFYRNIQNKADIFFCTVYVDKDKANITAEWIKHNTKLNNIGIIFCKNWETGKKIPDDLAKEYDNFIVIEDCKTQLFSISSNIKKINNNALIVPINYNSLLDPDSLKDIKISIVESAINHGRENHD